MNKTTRQKERTLKINILRYNPRDNNSTPHIATYEIEEAFGMTLFIALNEIREKYDGSLQVDFFCGTGYCGSCAMLINGRPGLACKALTRNLDTNITLVPLPMFELIGDLSVNLSSWIAGTSDWLITWIHRHGDKEIDIQEIKQKLKPKIAKDIYISANNVSKLHFLEDRMEPEIAEEIYKLQSCIDCGCCVAASETASMREKIGKINELNTIAKLKIHTNDENNDYELVSNGQGVFGLTSFTEYKNICPKNLSLQLQFTHMIRKMIELNEK